MKTVVKIVSGGLGVALEIVARGVNDFVGGWVMAIEF
jgi:hypothetical protein